MRGANLIADTPCRYADDLYPVNHRALQQLIGVEARSVVLDVAGSCRSRPRRPPDAHGHLSQGDGLCQDPVPNARLQATRRGHVHMTPADLLNVKRETAEVEQRGVRTRGYQEIHVTRLDRFPASYRTEYTHIMQAALGRGRENQPPSRPKEHEIRRPFLLRWTWHNESFPGTTCYSCPSPLHGTRGRAFRVASCRASQLTATRIAQSRMPLARQASSPSSPSRRTSWHARPTRQLLYVTGWL